MALGPRLALGVVVPRLVLPTLQPAVASFCSPYAVVVPRPACPCRNRNAQQRPEKESALRCLEAARLSVCRIARPLSLALVVIMLPVHLYCTLRDRLRGWESWRTACDRDLPLPPSYVDQSR